MTDVVPAAGPHAVCHERNVVVPLPDGTRLGASLYLPDTPGRFPTTVSYYPYRKDDLIGAMFEHGRQVLAAAGYATLLVDFRGCGASEGVCTTTFDLRREGADGAAVVEWAAAQPWSDGNVGVWGMSYGGCMSLAIAAERPPHLRAAFPMFPSADLFSHFVYPGGVPNCLSNGLRETFMLLMDLAPPTFDDPERDWQAVWRNRLERLERGDLYSLEFPAHRDLDEWWRRSTVDIERIEVPTYLIGGWNDVLLEGAVDAFERITARKHMLMGPWVHTPPDVSPYEPVDWPLELRRWFDRWVRDDPDADERGTTSLTYYVQGDGRWREAAAWPVPGTSEQALWLSPANRLSAERPEEDGEHAYEHRATVGVQGGLWDSCGLGIGYPQEQTPDDLKSLVFESAALERDVTLVGRPRLRVNVVLERGDELYLAAKLSHVAPDGTATHVATGVLNAEHRISHREPRAMPRGEVQEIELPLWATGAAVPAGHRWRLAIACGEFPRLYPTPVSPAIRVLHGPSAPSSLTLPVVDLEQGGSPEVDVPRPAAGVNRAPWTVDGGPAWEVRHDLMRDEVSVTNGSRLVLSTPAGARAEMEFEATATVGDAAPQAARCVSRGECRIDLPSGERAVVTGSGRFTRDSMRFAARVTLDGETLLERRWPDRA